MCASHGTSRFAGRPLAQTQEVSLVKLPKEQYEAFAQFFEEPTRDKLRNLIEESIGETDHLDFKAEWPEFPKVAKHILAFGNSGGGAIVVGLSQTENGEIEAPGVSAFVDKADIGKRVKKYLPSGLAYTVLDFHYKTSEYEKIKGKKFQVLLVEYDPKIIPLLSLASGKDISSDTAYVRHQTESVPANHEQLEKLINARIETGYSSTAILDLKEHLEQLKVLYSMSKNNMNALASLSEQIFGNPFSEYHHFIEGLIKLKRQRIIKELEL